MLKGFAITPVVLGRISIGGVVEKNGKRLPVKKDHFTITSNSQKDGEWIPHPIASKLNESNKGKLLSIPVRLMFDQPGNNFRAQYTCFDEKGRTLCTGDGEQAKRRDSRSEEGISDHACPGPDRCQFGRDNRCKPYGRLIVGIEQAWQHDPLAGFMLRTTSWNSIRALTARLSYFHAMTNGRLAGMSCNLVLRSKSTSGSMRQPIYYVDLEPRDSLSAAIAELESVHKQWNECGINRGALEKAVSEGYAQSAFMESEEDGAEILEEFYQSTADAAGDPIDGAGQSGNQEAAAGGWAGRAQTRSSGEASAGSSTPAVMSEKEEASVQNSISRLVNIKDPKGLEDAMTWARMRYAGNEEAISRVEKAIEQRRAILHAEQNQEPLQAAA